MSAEGLGHRINTESSPLAPISKVIDNDSMELSYIRISVARNFHRIERIIL
jgi:hypothetical protein